MRYAILFLLLAGCGGTVAHDLPRDVPAEVRRPQENTNAVELRQAVNSHLFLRFSTDERIVAELLRRLNAPRDYDIRCTDGSDNQLKASVLSERPYHFATRDMLGLAVRCRVEMPCGGWPNVVRPTVYLEDGWELASVLTNGWWPAEAHFYDHDNRRFGPVYYKSMIASDPFSDDMEPPETLSFILLVRPENAK